MLPTASTAWSTGCHSTKGKRGLVAIEPHIYVPDVSSWICEARVKHTLFHEATWQHTERLQDKEALHNYLVEQIWRHERTGLRLILSWQNSVAMFWSLVSTHIRKSKRSPLNLTLLGVETHLLAFYRHVGLQPNISLLTSVDLPHLVETLCTHSVTNASHT